jgi:hypothetical protein
MGRSIDAIEFEVAPITLRDYFAAQALLGIDFSDIECSLDDYAELAYEMADAMIRAREADHA